ncbi:MAG: PilZ domain-containing protein [Geobacteraceae bacterium]|nr:PilZ domain-containing protein [Geobacteraceae bacterium]
MNHIHDERLTTMHDNRRYERYEVPLEIRVTWPGQTAQVGITKDFSDGGAFLMVVFEQEPPPDTVMELQLISQVMGQNAPVLLGRVIRKAADGIAFEFIPPPEQ